MELPTDKRILITATRQRKTGFMERIRIEHGHLDIQLHQGRQAINGFPEVDGLRIEVDGFDLGVRTHHDGAPLGKREPSIRKRTIQMKVGFVERIRFNATLPENLLQRIEERVKRDHRYAFRSGFLAIAALRELAAGH